MQNELSGAMRMNSSEEPYCSVENSDRSRHKKASALFLGVLALSCLYPASRTIMMREVPGAIFTVFFIGCFMAMVFMLAKDVLLSCKSVTFLASHLRIDNTTVDMVQLKRVEVTQYAHALNRDLAGTCKLKLVPNCGKPIIIEDMADAGCIEKVGAFCKQKQITFISRRRCCEPVLVCAVPVLFCGAVECLGFLGFFGL